MTPAEAAWVRDHVARPTLTWGHPVYVRAAGACDSTGNSHTRERPDICTPCSGSRPTHQCWHGEPIPEGIVPPPAGASWSSAYPLWIAGKTCRVRCACTTCRYPWLNPELVDEAARPTLFGEVPA